MNDMCNLKNVVYQATIFPKENLKDKKDYFGISSVRWKLGYNNHINVFSHERLRNQTTLSKNIWKLKNMGLTPKSQCKNLLLLAALMVDIICVWKKKIKIVILWSC